VSSSSGPGGSAESAPRTVSLVTLGCARNEVDSEELAARLTASGWDLTSADEASVVLVNTCGFIQAAKQESIDELFSAAESGAKVAAVGCLAERYGADLAGELPEAQVLSFDDYGDIGARLDELDTRLSFRRVIERVNHAELVFEVGKLLFRHTFPKPRIECLDLLRNIEVCSALIGSISSRVNCNANDSSLWSDSLALNILVKLDSKLRQHAWNSGARFRSLLPNNKCSTSSRIPFIVVKFLSCPWTTGSLAAPTSD